MLDVQIDRLNPFRQCMVEMSQLLLEPVGNTSLRTVFNHYGSSEDRLVSLGMEVIHFVCGMVSEMYIRFELLFRTWPFPLAKTVDPRVSQSEKDKVYDELEAAAACCMDEYFTERALKIAGSVSALQDDEVLGRAFRLAFRKCKLANMHLERLLALFKQSCEGNSPLIERLRQ